ncbi:Dol-P-Glc:Glc(2)Man(9)GlcNAc(2)-PP-Dol alpha-1-2-glucosyltransferase [Penicillium macrosclerotiorum]|uniref:Dol-P-Glc:Glc(2)Man(9)GlcNAc(2)-PP-Dol alpha-1-2-glucosyltransferase n=1 Tax=Penicillium macrosclerotiorum TaxID=303699 RepID=UPI0025478882|nr:Dol-P-Glc:Glc(2)Man(9)GlcNAc(2)-PP-Dol alpha-1-2-glucosyltransferase [Penicillium macrosclerotiorum]KAJ5666854.1 Dol-P-Glc:Glc(2)Man(9)GlcNAc(2)-PP-Dol alpha-1-2-glucosyltransferase [Penicillium macrosclerotiorum]
MSSAPESNLSRAARYAVPFALVLIPVWRTKVNAEVPEPYLDEVFHVPQAQAYWAHKWTHWDPKITTPPGLYLWSYLLCAILLALRGSPTQLDTEALRTTNVATTAVFLPFRLQTLSDAIHKVRNTRPLGARLSHTVLNICLFPPLFFFSGLYYTDILALLVVVEAYNWDLKRASGGRYAILYSLGFLAFGLLALVCRQTNIFWVSAFLGGLQVVRRVRHSSKACDSSDYSAIVKRGLQNEIYDPLVSEASLEDYVKTGISFAAASLKNPFLVIGSIIPHLIILGAFGAFVIWNDGVVLGHKEFHTAGIHLAQMLYIWPYFMFFSWPIIAVPVLNILLPRHFLPKYLNYGFPEKQKRLPGILATLVALPVMVAIVHFNTVVHPFTLADNRHYVFYVFRLLLGVHPAIKYSAVLVYFLCGWAVISAFGFSHIQAPPKLLRVPAAAKPAAPAIKPSPKAQLRETRKSTRSRKTPTKKETNPQQANQITPEVLAKVQQHLIQRRKEQPEPPRVSFVLIWLAATSLSLVTAPLVEPRYFIIPWVMWRLHLPPTPSLAVFRQHHPENEEERARADVVTNAPKFLETVWFVIINAVTGYVFLYKGFEWPQEPGKIQRFMW